MQRSALLLQTSASLYDNGYNYSTTGFILATLAAVNWKVFDGTKQGLALALFIAIAAPGSELLLNSQANLWHYSHPDVFGIVSWCASDAQPEAREEWCSRLEDAQPEAREEWCSRLLRFVNRTINQLAAGSCRDDLP